MCWEQNASWKSNAVISTLNTPPWLARIMQKKKLDLVDLTQKTLSILVLKKLLVSIY